MRNSLCLPLAVGLLLAVGGCGSSGGRPELGTVSGTVTMDGKPLAGVVVSFAPESGRTSSGVTDADGKYELTYAHGAKGAQVGKHSVHVSSQGGERGGGDPNAEKGASTAAKAASFQGKIPARYDQKSILTASVAAGKNTIDFKLESGGAGDGGDGRGGARVSP